MRKLPALLAVLLATACGGQKLSPEAIKAAMPSSAVVKIDAPNYTADAPAGGGTLRLSPSDPSTSLVAPRSPLAVTSYLFAAAVNGGVFLTLAPIALITELVPPTSCTDTACTWGPGSSSADLNDWMLVVTKNGAGYDFTLSGQPKLPLGAPFVPVITGTAFPGATPHRGHGTFTANLDDAWAGLAHAPGAVQQDFGAITVDWDARSSLSLGVTFLGTRNGDHPGSDPANPNRVNAVYGFDATAAGGDLRIGWRSLPPFTAEAPSAAATLHTQWLAGGAGVSDARYGTPDLAAGSAIVNYSQCWDGGPGYAMTFDPLDGALNDPSVCQIAPGDPVTITVPYP
jgi:hypothetical protein